MRDAIAYAYPNDTFMFILGLDEAIIGVEQMTMRVVYSESKCLKILMCKGLNFKDAEEHLEFNIKTEYMGDKTPVFVDDTM